MLPLAAMFISKFDDHTQRFSITFNRLKTKQDVIRNDTIKENIKKSLDSTSYFIELLRSL